MNFGPYAQLDFYFHEFWIVMDMCHTEGYSDQWHSETKGEGIRPE